MKSIKLLSILFPGIISFQLCYCQASKTETIMVNGNCGMCKKHIEKSALAAGATAASWNKTTRFLNISYDPAVSNSQKIQTAIAETGYDTQDYKATDSAYFKLDDCCQYDRKELKTQKKRLN